MAGSRLRVDGPLLRYPDGTPALLRGFNLMFELDSEFELPRKETDDLMMERLPGTNLVRLVMLHWDDRPTEGTGDRRNDCAESGSGTVQSGRLISRQCLEQFDAILRWAHGHGMWAIITARASIAAGEVVNGVEGANVFANAALRNRFVRMWAQVAARYKDFDGIAAYEILSEPRVRPGEGEISADDVRGFYEVACSAIHAEDARTPCMIGAAPYYRASALEDVLIPNGNVIYAFNFFVPKAYVNGEARDQAYPGSMRCCDAYAAGSWRRSQCCAEQCCDKVVPFDRGLLQQQLSAPLQFSHSRQVPVLLDQWGVQRDAIGRATYLSDMQALLLESGVHWTYWQWRQREYSAFTVVKFGKDWREPDVHSESVAALSQSLGDDVQVLAAAPPCDFLKWRRDLQAEDPPMSCSSAKGGRRGCSLAYVRETSGSAAPCGYVGGRCVQMAAQPCAFTRSIAPPSPAPVVLLPSPAIVLPAAKSVTSPEVPASMLDSGPIVVQLNRWSSPPPQSSVAWMVESSGPPLPPPSSAELSGPGPVLATAPPYPPGVGILPFLLVPLALLASAFCHRNFESWLRLRRYAPVAEAPPNPGAAGAQLDLDVLRGDQVKHIFESASTSSVPSATS